MNKKIDFNRAKKIGNRLAVMHSLRDTIEKNSNALDNVNNWINRVEDSLKYKEDLVLRDDLNTLKYIKLCLEYLDSMYAKSYKQVGGK